MSDEVLRIVRIYKPGEPMIQETKMLPAAPGFKDLEFVHDIIGCTHLEHVSVLFEGQRNDMFCDEDFREKGLPFNLAATEIYRAATMSRIKAGAVLRCSILDLPMICGTAIVITPRVWF